MTDRQLEPPILQVQDLHMNLERPTQSLRLINGISFSVNRGEALGIVGESGAGKTMLALSMIGRPPPPYGRIVGGHVLYKQSDLLGDTEARRLIGKNIGFVFENPGASLDPCYKIGAQIAETIMAHEAVSDTEARRRAVELLGLVGIPDPQSACDSYPHQFSGGMQQRAVIAIALSCNPDVLIADNPTSALDVTIQRQIVSLIEGLRERFGLTLVWISHNLGLVARLCDRIAIMYSGQLVEVGPVDDVIHRPIHPYTKALVGMSKEIARGRKLKPIEGTQPNVDGEIAECLFAPRCALAEPTCRAGPIAMDPISESHTVRCILARKEPDRARPAVSD
jgi:oligopeptide/dipeptide ABC transporter ATP-binding protein